MTFITGSLRTLNQLLSAGIAITAFSLVLYALSFNLRERVVRSFVMIMTCVLIVAVGEALASIQTTDRILELWLKLQWVGLFYLPASYLYFSDALMSTTGRPSRGRRRLLVRLSFVFSTLLVLTLPFSVFVGPLVPDGVPEPHLQRTSLSWVFTIYYAGWMILSWVNFTRAFQRTVTSTSRRRMRYLLTGALGPALGSFPYLFFGSNIAADHQLIFWFAGTASNLFVSALIVVMAYAIAFFGVPWPDRVIKRRLFKWVMRGPVTGSTVLAVGTLVGRWGVSQGPAFIALEPISMIATLLLMQYLITLAAPVWERWFFYGGDRENIQLIQELEERMLTTSDLSQFLESVLTAICDRFQVESAFVVALQPEGDEFIVTVGKSEQFRREDLSDELLHQVVQNGNHGLTTHPARLFTWADHWLIPLFGSDEDPNQLLGLLGVTRTPEPPDEEQVEALVRLSQRAQTALEDRYLQQQVFISLEQLSSQVDFIQRLRAASRYEVEGVLDEHPVALDHADLEVWVKDALSHYWGGPKLTESPLLKLRVVQQGLAENDQVPSKALRSILREGIERIKPEGERRFTAEWILYNILEMKFLEGRKVREIAMRLAMSEADLYRKQRVAIEAVANAIVEMEKSARQEDHYGMNGGERMVELRINQE